MKNSFLSLLIGALFLPCLLVGQEIPADKTTDWSLAGVKAALPSFDTLDVTAFGVVGDGATANDAALLNLLSTYVDAPTVFYFPAGEYLFHQPILLKKAQIIKGASSEETTLLSGLATEDHSIIIAGQPSGQVANLATDVAKDTKSFLVDNAALFQAGDFIKTISEDGDLVTSEWATYSTGQILRISQVEGNTIYTEEALRKPLLLNEAPRIEKIAPLQFAGVECLRIERMNATVAQTSNIYFSYAANCWVKGVDSRNCNFAHVEVENSAHIEVSGSHFKDAFAYGGGGQGYGVMLEFSSSDCLVENNIFDHLRHAMILQAGANGNVFSYNYSINPFWTELSLPEDAAGDMVLHGNYPYLNLFEGNICQNIVIDDSHGANGPGNTFFRNRAEYYGIVMNDDVPSNEQVFIGNEITSNSFLLGFYALEGEGHFEFGNNVKGNIIPENTSAPGSSSLYLTTAPDFFQEMEMGFSSIGLPNGLNAGSIPALEHFTEGDLARCEVKEVDIVNTVANSNPVGNWQVFPNPATKFIWIKEPESVTSDLSISIANLTGQMVLSEKTSLGAMVDLSSLQPGVYFLILENGVDKVSKKIIVAE